MTEREIFVAALHQAGLDERRAFLDHACGADADLRGQVEGLLAEHDRLGSFLEQPAAALQSTAAFEPDGDSPATARRPAAVRSERSTIGPYKLLEVIGEGGMGTVWMADQAEPIRRRVAVKVVKAGMDTRQVLARFEAERQALALMDHPNIARVLDAGTTDDGRPYFVMELVKGVPLTRFCDERHLSVSDRLRVFQQVCHAVQHAHQKGVIHRDLKPTNVLVELHDGRPVPKVIDFGLAKAVGAAALTDRSLFTNFGTVLGTPLYMAPEQADFGALDVDTRADVYALGVLLYELLTGTTPLERKRLAAAAWDEVRRVIKEEEPQTPSARLSSSAGRASVAALRQSEPGKLGRFVHGDLDWVVMKALAKERDRRYESASAFAADVERFLNLEPVAAGPPSTTYRLRRFVRRNRRAVAASTLLLGALVAGAVGTTVGMVRADAARRDAEAAQAAEADRAAGERLAKIDAQAKAAEAERERNRAAVGEKLAGDRLVQVEEEKRIATAVLAFLQQGLLNQANVHMRAAAALGQGRPVQQADDLKDNPTVRQLLDRAARGLAPDKIETNFPGQPLVQAEILHTVGTTYLGIGEPERAVGFLERAAAIRAARLPADHADTPAGLVSLAQAYLNTGALPRAIEVLRSVRDARLSRLGANHRDTLSVQRDLASLGDESDDVRQTIARLEPIRAAQVKALGPDDPDTLITLRAIGMGYRRLDEPHHAFELLERVYDAQEKVLGPHHPRNDLDPGPPGPALPRHPTQSTTSAHD